MTMVRLRLTFFCLITAMINIVLASNSLNWQEVEIEKNAYQKINRSLAILLKDGEYLVEVDVKVNDPGGPNFDSLNKAGLKISDVEFDDSKGDYIAFSKVGLELPVVEKLYIENQRKLLEIHKFNEAYDIFKNIDSVKIIVFLSDLLKEETFSKAENIVKSLTFSFGDVKPKIVFQKLAMQVPPVKPQVKPKENLAKKKNDNKLSLKEILEFISKFGNAIGLILATVLFGLFGYWLLKKYFEGMKDLQENKDREENDDQLEQEPLSDDEVQREGGNEAMSPGEIDQFLNSSPEENFERLRKFIENNPKEACGLFKKWIHGKSQLETNALKVCVQEFSENELELIYSGLTEIDRDIWRSHIDSFLIETEIHQACKFIAEEVLREMIGPRQIDDLELLDLILSLKPSDTILFVTQNHAMGTQLLNLINESFLNKLIEKASPDEMSLLVKLGVDTENISFSLDSFSKLKNELNEFQLKRKSNPFSRRVVSMLESLAPEKEILVYRLLSGRHMRDELFEAAKVNLPSSLVLELPKKVLESTLKSYPVDKKTTLLLSLSEQYKHSFLEACAPEGSTARDIINMEMGQYESDEIALANIKKNQARHLGEFTKFVRAYVKLNESSQKEIEPIISGWLENITQQEQSEKGAA